MQKFFRSLSERGKKMPTILKVLVVSIVLLVIASFSIPKVLMNSSSSFRGNEMQELNYGAPASAPAPAEEGMVAGGACGDYYAARSKSVAEYEQKADTTSFTDAVSKDGAAGARFDLMTSAYAAEVFRPQIIKTANLTLEVENIVDSIKKIENITTAHGGLITNKNVSISGEHNEYRSGNMQVRVPQPKLEKFLDNLNAMGIPRQETVSSQDVGAEVVDLESRIRNSKAQEQVLLGIMQRSGKIPDVLQVAQELSRVRQEIEQMQGRLNYLRQQVAYSTVNIQLMEKTLVSATQGKPSFIDVIGNAAKKAFGDLLDFVNALLAFIVGFAIFWIPVLFILWLAATLLWRLLLKKPFTTIKSRWDEGNRPE